jgi:hypothetical protein
MLQLQQGDIIVDGGSIVVGVFVLFNSDIGVAVGGRRIPGSRANPDREPGAVVGAMSCGEHPVVPNEGTAAKISVVNVDGRLPRELAACGRFSTDNLLFNHGRVHNASVPL